MKSFTIFTTLALAFAPFVAGHGFVNFMTVDGKQFNGPSPGHGSKTPSAIRQVTSIDPTYGASSAALNCGPGAQAASLSATAKPGSSLAFHWVAAPNMKWPHNTGAELTYMASCGNQDCSKFDSTKAKWFKINQYGLTNGKWAQATDAFVGKSSPAKVPDNLAPGNYLVMHQMISLHIADHLKGAEFYSSCAQLKVTGNGTGAPSSKELVSIPGAYKDTDPGLLVNAFNSNLKYNFPGPQISNLAASSSTPSNNTGGNNTPSDPSIPTTPTKPTGNNNSNNGGSCHKSKRSHNKRSSEYKPRQVSRVMRDIAEELTSEED